MAYLIPIVLVLLLVSGAVTYVVLNATRRSKPSAAENSGDADPGTMAAADSSPVGDTTEHAGEQSEAGETVEAPEGEGHAQAGGTGDGEGEGSRAETPDAPRPESERLADRPHV
jgi:hypothetical protein